MKNCKLCNKKISGYSITGRKYYGKQLLSKKFCSSRCARLLRSKLNNSNIYKNNNDGSTTLIIRGESFLLDTKDVPLASKFIWYANKDGYLVNVNKTREPNAILLHRFLFKNIPSGLCVDHINRNKCDNRRSNLRIVSYTQNNLNTGIRKDNKTGVRGVSYATRDKVYRAEIQLGDKKECYSFKKIEDAINKRAELQLKYGFN